MHIRCHMDDARIAVQTGVDGAQVSQLFPILQVLANYLLWYRDVVIGASPFLLPPRALSWQRYRLHS